MKVWGVFDFTSIPQGDMPDHVTPLGNDGALRDKKSSIEAELLERKRPKTAGSEPSLLDVPRDHKGVPLLNILKHIDGNREDLNVGRSKVNLLSDV